MKKLVHIEGKGRGVITTTAFKKGRNIEEIPYLSLPFESIEGSKLDDYVIAGDDYLGEGNVAVMFGFGSLYNHDFKPNAKMLFDEAGNLFLEAIRDIEPGEEITHGYLFNNVEEAEATGIPMEGVKVINCNHCGIVNVIDSNRCVWCDEDPSSDKETKLF